MRIPLLVGNIVEVVGVLFGLYLISFAFDVPSILLRFLVYLVAWGCLLFFPHGLTHYIIGRLVGISFQYYYLGRSSVYKLKLPFVRTLASRAVVLTLKVDQRSLRSASPGSRAVMFCSGAVASMVLPFFAAVTSLGSLPMNLTAILLLLSAANLVFDLYYSPKASDIARAKSATCAR
jgi:hypothetical protein